MNHSLTFFFFFGNELEQMEMELNEERTKKSEISEKLEQERRNTTHLLERNEIDEFDFKIHSMSSQILSLSENINSLTDQRYLFLNELNSKDTYM